MKRLLIILLLVPLMSGCIYNSQPHKTESKSGSKLTTQALFEMKQKCSAEKSGLEKTISTYNSQQRPQKRGDNDGSFSFCLEQKELGEIFYSESINTCLHIERTDTLCSPSENGQYHTSYQYYYLIDTLTGEEIENVRTISRGEQFQQFSKVESMISNYKK